MACECGIDRYDSPMKFIVLIRRDNPPIPKLECNNFV